jgi:hypothetical protein
MNRERRQQLQRRATPLLHPSPRLLCLGAQRMTFARRARWRGAECHCILTPSDSVRDTDVTESDEQDGARAAPQDDHGNRVRRASRRHVRQPRQSGLQNAVDHANAPDIARPSCTDVLGSVRGRAAENGSAMTHPSAAGV